MTAVCTPSGRKNLSASSNLDSSAVKSCTHSILSLLTNRTSIVWSSALLLSISALTARKDGSSRHRNEPEVSTATTYWVGRSSLTKRDILCGTPSSTT